MRPRPHIALVGLSGTGKSTVAPLLADLLDRRVVDLDAVVAKRTGVAVGELIATQGEKRFRQLELEALDSALSAPASVLATGGGLVTTPAARRLLAERATVVWLRASVEELASRLEAHDEDRPLLGDDPRGKLRAMATERDPLYEALADVVLDLGGRDPAGVAAVIAQALEVDR